MGYSISLQDDDHIIIVTIDDQYDMVNDIVPLSLDVVAQLDKGPERVIVIVDGRAVKVTDLNSMLMSAQNMTRPEVKASRSHPNVLKSYSVVDNKLVTAAMKGMNTASFGYIQITLFETVEAAIAQARIELAEHRAS